MIVLIDNYDSFSYNLYQMLGEIGPEIKVVRNDACTPEDILDSGARAVVLSPGPGRPADAGICVETVRRLSGLVPILGVCLGHQAVAEAFGGTVGYASELMHGKSSTVEVDTSSALFAGMNPHLTVGRYHSLAVDEESLPSCLRVTGRAEDGEVMALELCDHPTFGVQFHPESVLTPQGKDILANFVKIAHEEYRPSSVGVE